MTLLLQIRRERDGLSATGAYAYCCCRWLWRL